MTTWVVTPTGAWEHFGNTPWQHKLGTPLRNTPWEHKQTQHTSWEHLGNTPWEHKRTQHTLGTHLGCDYLGSHAHGACEHLGNTPWQHKLGRFWKWRSQSLRRQRQSLSTQTAAPTGFCFLLQQLCNQSRCDCKLLVAQANRLCSRRFGGKLRMPCSKELCPKKGSREQDLRIG